MVTSELSMTKTISRLFHQKNKALCGMKCHDECQMFPLHLSSSLYSLHFLCVHECVQGNRNHSQS